MVNLPNYSELDKKLVWHPYTSLQSHAPLFISGAKGIYLNTPDGRNIMDAVSSWWVNIHGHANPVLAEAVYGQALQMEHVIFAGFTHKPAIDLANSLSAILPGQQARFFFSDDGSTAVEVGLKLAIQYWYNLGSKRNKIIALQGAYHGDTFGTMSVAERTMFNAPFGPYLFETEFLPMPGCNNIREFDKKLWAQTIRAMKNMVSEGDVAAFIFEPLLQGTAGMCLYPVELLDTLIEIAQANNIICIADEVMTGFGRTGPLFASDYLQNKPDIFCLSKGLTGGMMPMGLTTCNSAVAQAFDTSEPEKTFFHGHSYTGNPLACAVAIASLQLLLSDDCTESRKMINQKHLLFLETVKNNPFVKNVRVLGTVFAMEVVAEKKGYFSNIRNYLYGFFLERDILLRPLGNIIYIMPPYIIKAHELDIIYLAITELLSDLESHDKITS